MPTNVATLISVGIVGLGTLFRGAGSTKIDGTHSTPGIGFSSAIYYSSFGWFSTYVPDSASAFPASASQSYYSLPSSSSFNVRPPQSFDEVAPSPLVPTVITTPDVTGASGTMLHSITTQQVVTPTEHGASTAANTTTMNGGVSLEEMCGTLGLVFAVVNGLLLGW